MLVVLSEIDCRATLTDKHVYPHEFYTDLEVFKNRTVFMRDAIVLVIFAGNCRFNKRHTLEFIKTLMRRAETERDSGIKKVYIVSDMTLAGIRSYYRYTGNLDLVDIMHGWQCVKPDVDIWRKLATEERETTCYLSVLDSGDVEPLIEQYKGETHTPDEYAKLVQVPDLWKMFKPLEVELPVERPSEEAVPAPA